MLETFKILKTIGAGATSEVFQAINQETDKTVALKCFHPVLMQDPEVVQRLRGEVDVLKSLHHPNIVGLHSEHFSEGRYWLEIDFVDGGDLRQWLNTRAGDPLLEPKIFALVQIARGLGHAHELAIVHRDLKPENVLVAKDGRVRITDFGLARSMERLTVTRLGLLVGSLGYMAPELINGMKTTLKSDLFSFGVVAYEVLTGKAPFAGDTPQALIRSLCDGDYRKLKDVAGRIPPRIADLIDRCLAVSPDARPASIWEVEAALMNHLQEAGTLSLCRDLMIDDSKLQECLKRKHVAISERVAELLKRDGSEPEARRELVYLATELTELFPGDELIQKIFAHLGDKGERPIFFWIACAALALCLAGSATWFFWPRPSTGFIRFEMDPEVTIKVDGKSVLTADRLNYATSPGNHHIEIGKDGFDPIQSDVEVAKGHTTVIRAGQ